MLDEAGTRLELSRQIAVLAESAKLVVVHGGGRQMTRFLTERGVESRFVNGLRVTTPDVLDAVVKVVAGSVNRELVSALNRFGARAVGISGIDGGLVEAEQMDPALGGVGRVTRSDPALLEVLTARAFCRWWRAWRAAGKGTSTMSMRTRWRWPARWRSA